MIHHVAQNLSITTFPNKSPERTILPSRLGRLKAGMALRCCTAVKPVGSVLVCTVQPAPMIPEDPATRNSLLFICILLESPLSLLTAPAWSGFLAKSGRDFKCGSRKCFASEFH